jgi:hypothetical protein
LVCACHGCSGCAGGCCITARLLRRRAGFEQSLAICMAIATSALTYLGIENTASADGEGGSAAGALDGDDKARPCCVPKPTARAAAARASGENRYKYKYKYKIYLRTDSGGVRGGRQGKLAPRWARVWAVRGGCAYEHVCDALLRRLNCTWFHAGARRVARHKIPGSHRKASGARRGFRAAWASLLVQIRPRSQCLSRNDRLKAQFSSRE